MRCKYLTHIERVVQGDVSQTLTSSQLKYECITERRSYARCRPQGATLRKVRSLKHTEIRPSDDISYVIKIKRTHLYPLRFYVQYFHFTLIR